MRVLLVEDSRRLRETVGTWLRHHGYVVDTGADGEGGWLQAKVNDYDVIVLDVMLPKMDGLEILKRLRECRKDTHVLLLTARDTVADRVRGLELGADDYLVKPFALEELLARVNALCRRAYGGTDGHLTVGDLAIDTNARKVRRAGQVVGLQPREYALLEYLARRRGHIVTRSEIEAHIYGGEVDTLSNSVDSAICGLRRKLAEFSSVPLIHTRRGLGYELEAE
jgi:DNA-binding response OmpR family regulator